MDYTKLKQALELAKKKDATLLPVIVNAPFAYKVDAAFLFLGIIMLALVNPEKKVLEAKAISQTDFVEDIDTMAAMPVDNVFIPLDDNENLLVQAINSGQPQTTRDWSSLLHPVMTAEQARFTQASGGIAFTAVHPLNNVGAGGALIYSFFKREDADVSAQDNFTHRYTDLVATL